MFRLPNNLSLEQARDAWRSVNNVAPRSTPCFRMADGDVPKLYVFDMIGGWDSDAGEFVRAVHDLGDAGAVDVHINSPGGFVYDAVAMYEALLAAPQTVNVLVDGLAASAASFLMQAGDVRKVAKAGRVMIHDAQMIAIGSPADLREAADLGDEVSNDIAGIYAARAGGKPADWRTAMTATTWYNASQTVDAGLADQVTGGDKKTSGASNVAARMLRARAAVALGRGKQ